VHVVRKKPARKSDRGVVDLRLDIVNQRDETVQTGTAKILIKRQPLGAAA
jgi:acyl dehydratase